MGKQLFPGKGAHLVLNQEVLDFLRESLERIESGYSDEDHDENPAGVLDEIANAEDTPWTSSKDNFGTKLYAAMPYKEGELRVTVVLTGKNELKLDIREWYAGN